MFIFFCKFLVFLNVESIIVSLCVTRFLLVIRLGVLLSFLTSAFDHLAVNSNHISLHNYFGSFIMFP